ncbi:hypothetical protein [Nonomuraea sediminis]|uniref:hypothetical protein n=1 Tax=Nonomuraea sediminis TaxID=2835864 RepID=UPI001BDC0588|nr:hypothetical protein [Nonomuraea sediminis]
MIQSPDAPPVPPQSYWPDAGSRPPSGSKPPGWAKGILAGATVVTLVGGLSVGLRNAGSSTPPPLAEPSLAPPSLDLPSGVPSSLPTSLPSESAAVSESPTPSATSTYPPLKAVPEVCDLLPANLIAKLAPKAVSEPGVQKDGYGALRKGCEWTQKTWNKTGTVPLRSIHLSVNVWPSVDDARGDFEDQIRSMKDMAGTKEENPGLRYLSTYAPMKDFAGVGDEAHAMYTSNLKGTTNVWAEVVAGNATLEIRYFGTDFPDGDILAQGDKVKPVPEDVLMKGAQDVATQAVKALTS